MMVPKFRGWDRKNHVMYDFMMMCFNVNLKNVLYRNNLTDFDVDMYTGLKDANGKEIYEGDIVKYHNFDDKYQYLPIIWLDQDCLVSAGGYRIDIVARRCEVIGNVHENPELVEGK